ncbi:hypothetical protein AAFF_G00235170 [Aldrovandia affinis]|uniref:Uncharacterized protein n=1 Tax=Aldrovandia affinis TaxID=143900 RepID=A0AAD7WV10_9TELE|nr:hypothetical protein AAFF_G00235170 [Aldrovandia affinis]
MLPCSPVCCAALFDGMTVLSVSAGSEVRGLPLRPGPDPGRGRESAVVHPGGLWTARAQTAALPLRHSVQEPFPSLSGNLAERSSCRGSGMRPRLMTSQAGTASSDSPGGP